MPSVGDTAQVIFVDYCPSDDQLRTLLADLAFTGNVMIVDHHKSAKEKFEQTQRVPRVRAFFDLEESGASLAWKTFAGTCEMPKLVRYVRDSDLWKFELVDSRPIRAYLTSLPKELSAFDSAATILRRSFEYAAACGKAIMANNAQQVQKALRHVRKLSFSHDNSFEYHYVSVNSTVHASEVGEALLKAYPDADFAHIWQAVTDQYGAPEVVHSLRSREGGFDVSKLAVLKGGGGHAAAAGFKTDFRNTDVLQL
jgi:oligoribonuclease NrnB/cAMP/cGMP phosphodiesterase (DHH superfamily)